MKLSKPLESRPAVVRTAVGLVAINSLILAVCVWGWVMVRPRSEPGTNDYDLTNAVLPMPPAEKEPEGKAPEAGGHEGSAHEGGEHEGAAKSKKAKTPPKTEKKAPDKKGAAKKPAKTEEHGHE